jgi:hypothetical protein
MKTKKVLAAAVLAAVTLGVAAPAFAATDDLKFSGEIRLRWTSDDGSNDSTDSRLRLVVSKDIDANWSAKARFAKSQALGSSTADVSEVDQLSLTYKSNDGKTTATMGKDDVWMGAGLLMDGTFEAIQLATKVGGLKVSAFGGRDNFVTDDTVTPVVYTTYDVSGASIQTKVGKADFGVNYLKVDDVKAWSVNAGEKFGKFGITAEYADVKDADAQNLMVAGTYGDAVKKGDTKLTVMYYNTEYANHWTTLDVADPLKGVSVQADHMMADNVKLTLEQQINDTVDRSRVYVTAKF